MSQLSYFIDRYPSEDPPLTIEFYERIYQPATIKIYGKISDEYIPTTRSVSMWQDTGLYQKINPDNPVLLPEVSTDWQLFSHNKDLIELLFNEAHALDQLIPQENGTIRINVASLRKLTNSATLDRWVVYRDRLAPSLGFQLTQKINSYYRR